MSYTSDHTAQRPEDGHRKFTLTFEAIGTHWEIETSKPLGHPLRRRVLERIEAFDATYSRFRRDSLVSRIALAREGGRFDFPDDSISLFDLYERLNSATDGAVDPLVGRDLELLGYDPAYTLSPHPTRSERGHTRPDAPPGLRTSAATAARS